MSGGASEEENSRRSETGPRTVETAECDVCDTPLAKNDDARRERNGRVFYYCDKCLAKLARGEDPRD